MDNAGKKECQELHDALDAAGLGRTSNLGGGELTGLTNAIGSTGFSVRRTDWCDAPSLDWHVVVSGKHAGIRFRNYTEYTSEGEMEMHKPVDADKIHEAIANVFHSLGMTVREVRTTGWQCHWDDDIDYNIITDMVPTLSDAR